MIIYHNPGLLPIDAIRLMGASVKSAGAFGRFGTGFKYAVATILRGGGNIRIWLGEQELGFSLRGAVIKEQAFEEVTLTGAWGETPLGFTTQLGKDWEPWMAHRELACNARDEGGGFDIAARKAVPECFGAKDGETVIVVEWPEMDDAAAVDDQHVFISPELDLLLEERGVRVHAGPSDYLYHRGVRVWKLPKPAVFTYDITDPVDLTEDRTVKYAFCVVANVRNMILQTEERSIIAGAVTAKKGTWEHSFDWTGEEWNAVPPGQAWLDEVAELRERRRSDYDAGELTKSASDVMLRHRAFKEKHHSSSWSTYSGETEALNVASAVLDDLGLGLGEGDDGIEVYITQALPGGALSAIDGGRVYLSTELLQRRTSVIVSQLIRRVLEVKGEGDHDKLLDFTAERLFSLALRNDRGLERDHKLAEEEGEHEAAGEGDLVSAPLEPPPPPAPEPSVFDNYAPEDCPGHVASADDAKVCGLCGTHIEELRDEAPDMPF